MTMYKNGEGYADPTAGEALSKVMKEYKREKKRICINKHRKKIYVASKYAGDVKKNTEDALRYCRHVVDMGGMPIASHLMYPALLCDDVPAERELGLAFGLALLAICDEVWVFGEISSGMEGEINEARRLKKPLRYIEEVGV